MILRFLILGTEAPLVSPYITILTEKVLNFFKVVYPMLVYETSRKSSSEVDTPPSVVVNFMYPMLS